MIYFTADTHFSHRNIIKYCNRPFSSIEEHDEVIITNWNSVVRKNDIVYHLGDFAFGDVQKHLRRLNGNIHLILGSHDKNTKNCKHLFASYNQLLNTKIEGINITLSHCSMRIWHKSHYNAFSLYGHSHGMLEPWGKSFDCGVDTNNFYPYSWEQVKDKMNTLPDNFNLVRSKL